MTDLHMPILRQAKSNDLPAIRALLGEVGLPVTDLDSQKLANFLVAEDAAVMLGLIGIELYDTIGLLRSLVVSQDARSQGLGGKLIGALEAAADTAGVTELWLLTIDAQDFFQRHGFEIVDRSTAPESIRSTAEFASLCPGNAYLMMKSID